VAGGFLYGASLTRGGSCRGRWQEGEQEKGAVYRAMLIQAIHTCAVRFPDVADSVVHVLMDFLSGDGAIDVIVFVRWVLMVASPLWRHSLCMQPPGSSPVHPSRL
jgi:hypothetical protein